MNRNQIFLILTFVCVGILVIAMIINIVRTARGKEASKAAAVVLHLAGIAAAVFNAIRIAPLYQDNRGVMIAANVIVIISLVVSLLRTLNGVPQDPDEDEPPEK